MCFLNFGCFRTIPAPLLCCAVVLSALATESVAEKDHTMLRCDMLSFLEYKISCFDNDRMLVHNTNRLLLASPTTVVPPVPRTPQLLSLVAPLDACSNRTVLHKKNANLTWLILSCLSDTNSTLLVPVLSSCSTVSVAIHCRCSRTR